METCDGMYITPRDACFLELSIRITIEPQSQLSNTTLEDNICYSLENDVSAVVSFQTEVKSDGSTTSEL